MDLNSLSSRNQIIHSIQKLSLNSSKRLFYLLKFERNKEVNKK